jgi:regulatory protein
VAVFVDDREHATVPLESVQAAGLRVGDAVDPDAMAALEAAGRAVEAREAAFRLLAVRPRAAGELARRLRAAGFGRVEVDSVLSRLDALGLVDDAAFSAMHARDRARLRPRSARRMVDELRARGVDDDTARAAVADALAAWGIDETELARRAVARWRPRRGETLDGARRRLYALLARRGFDPSVTRDVVEEVLRREAGGTG